MQKQIHEPSLMLKKTSHIPATKTEFFGTPPKRSPTGPFLLLANENEIWRSDREVIDGKNWYLSIYILCRNQMYKYVSSASSIL